MTTSQRQTLHRGVERSMFSQEDSPVSLSPSLVEERERKITATSGRKCYELYGRFSPLGSLARMLLDSSRWYSPVRRLTWDAQTLFSTRVTYTEHPNSSPSTQLSNPLKILDTPSKRLLFRLSPSEHHTDETEFGLLPTVQTQGLKTNQNGQSNPIPLDLLPTPSTQEFEHPNMEVNEKGRRNPVNGKTDHSVGLGDLALNGLLPTPTTQRGGGSSETDTATVFEGIVASDTQRPRLQETWAKEQAEISRELHTRRTSAIIPNGTRRNDKGSNDDGTLKESQQGELQPFGADCPQDWWRQFPSVSPVCRGNDGLPFDLARLAISEPKWRNEAIKAMGNAWVPQVAYEIFRVIQISAI